MVTERFQLSKQGHRAIRGAIRTLNISDGTISPGAGLGPQQSAILSPKAKPPTGRHFAQCPAGAASDVLRPFCLFNDPSVWTGRALQAESSERKCWSCASVSGPFVEQIAPGHHGYPRAFDLILRSAPKARRATRSRTRRRDRSPFFKSTSQTRAGISYYQVER